MKGIAMFYQPLLLEKVRKDQNRIVFWAIFHLFCLICLVAGLYYTCQYMHHPDRVIIQDRSGSLYRGYTGPILCRESAEDAARRAVNAFLNRSYEHNNREMCEAIFGKTAQKALFNLIAETRDEFEEQKVRQFPEITKMTIRPAEDEQCLVWVEGTLHRTGIYMDMPYYQKLEYVLGLRLAQSKELVKFPLRVLRMTYEERSIYDSKPQSPKKGDGK